MEDIEKAIDELEKLIRLYPNNNRLFNKLSVYIDVKNRIKQRLENLKYDLAEFKSEIK